MHSSSSSPQSFYSDSKGKLITLIIASADLRSRGNPKCKEKESRRLILMVNFLFGKKLNKLSLSRLFSESALVLGETTLRYHLMNSFSSQVVSPQE